MTSLSSTGGAAAVVRLLLRLAPLIVLRATHPFDDVDERRLSREKERE